MVEKDITNWINRISIPRDELGGFSVCPFAKNALYEIIETEIDDINPPEHRFELIIYKLPNNLTFKELDELTDKLNNKFSNYVFLPDQKDTETFINGVQTNNKVHNLILCQWRDDLNSKREKLQKTDYYTFWDEEYLKEILKK